MSTPTSILVIGAGELGDEVLQNLATQQSKGNRTIQIAVLLRASTISSQDPVKRVKVESYKALGIELVTGDVVNDAFDQLLAVFAGFHTVISCTGMTFPPGTQQKIAKATLAAGIQRYFPWQFGIDYDSIGKDSAQDLFDEQLEVRAVLRAQDRMAWVIVSTGMFISFLFEPAFGVVDLKAPSVTAIGSWDNALTVTSPQDIGKVTAELAVNAPDEQGVVFVAGDTVSMRELFNIVGRLTGKTVKADLKTLQQLNDDLLQSPNDGMRKYRAVFGAGVGVSWNKRDSWNELHGIDTVSAEQWAKEHLV